MAETIEKVIKAVHRYAAPLKSRRFETGDAESTEEKKVSTISYHNDGRMETEMRFSRSGEEEERHEYIYDANNKLIQHNHTMVMEGIEESFKTERDEKGRVIREVKMYSEDEGESTVYEYDENGNVVKVTNNDEEGNPFQTEETVFNKENKIVSRKITGADGRFSEYKLIYNEKGLLQQQEELDEKGNIISRTEVENDEKGNEISIVQYNAKNAVTQRVISSYDEKNRLVKRITKGFYTRITNFLYDDKDNIIEETTTDEHGNVISRSNFEFDESGRLIHEASFEMDLTRSGRDVTMTYRYEYEYY